MPITQRMAVRDPGIKVRAFDRKLGVAGNRGRIPAIQKVHL